MIAVISQDKFKPFNSMVELLLFVTIMLVVSIICGTLYMYFYNKYMKYHLKEEMQTGDFPEPDDIGNQ